MPDIEEINNRFEKKIEEFVVELPKKYKGGDVSQNCAQLTMRGFLEIIETEDRNLINMAAPLAAIADVCGAVNAGLMIVGLIVGKRGKKRLHQLNASAEGMRFLIRFKKEFESCHCKELTGGYDLLTREGMDLYIKDGIWEKKCYKHVIFALKVIGKLYAKQIARLM